MNTTVVPQEIIGNSSSRRSWFTNGMAGRAKLDRGRGLRAKCKSLSKTMWNRQERRQNNSVEKAFQRFALSFFFLTDEDNMISDEEFLLLYDECSSKNSEFQPENSHFEVRDRRWRTFWHARWLSCCKLVSLSNDDDGDVNENGDVNGDVNVKMSNVTYCGGLEHKTTTLFFFSWTPLRSFRIQFQKKKVVVFDELNEME